MADRQTKVTLSAQVQQYTQAMREAAKETREVGSATEKLTQQREAFQTLGRGMVIAGTAITAATVLSVKAAADWESAWAGVTKTVEGTPEQMAEVEDGLRSLSSVLPASHDEIAAVAEAAGQLGIQTDSVVAFTKTMIDLGETTNLSANDAATALARFVNIMGTSQDEVSNLGSALVGLGNNYATTEAEITEMALRLAGAGKQIGLSEGDVLGLSTALSSVGIEAEAGGSAFSKVMIDIAASVEEGGDRLGLFAQTAGVTADEFAAKWRTAPSEALSLFVKGLANAEAQGSSTLGVLSELGITEVRMRDALLRSSAAADLFADAMAQGNDEFEANNALTLEAVKRYQTTESQLRIMGNAINDAAISFGEVFLPAVAGAAQGVAGFAQMLGDIPQPVQGLLGLLTGVAGVVTLVGGAAFLAVPKIVEFRLALQTLGLSIGRLAFVGGGVTLAITALVTAVGSLAAAQAAARQRAEQYADAIGQGESAVKELTIANLAAERSFLWMSRGSAFDAAERLGVSLETVTEAALGNAEALDELSLYTRAADGDADALHQVMDDTGLSIYEASDALDSMITSLREQGVALEDGKRIQEQKTSADRDATAATRDNAEVTKTAADQYLDAAENAGKLDDQLRNLLDTINESNNLGQDAISSNLRYQETIARVEEAIKNGETGLDDSTEAGRRNQQMLIDLARDSQDAAQSQFDLDQDVDNLQQTLEDGRRKLIEYAEELGYSADEAEDLADEIYAIPDTTEFKVIADTAGAEAAIARIKAALNYVDTTEPVVQIKTAGLGTIERRASGGPIVGPGSGTSDSVPILASNGEHVWTAAEVSAAGGHSAVEDMRRWVRSGGRVGGGGTTINQTINPQPGMSEEHIAQVSAERTAFVLRGLG